MPQRSGVSRRGAGRSIRRTFSARPAICWVSIRAWSFWPVRVDPCLWSLAVRSSENYWQRGHRRAASSPVSAVNSSISTNVPVAASFSCRLFADAAITAETDPPRFNLSHLSKVNTNRQAPGRSQQQIPHETRTGECTRVLWWRTFGLALKP